MASAAGAAGVGVGVTGVVVGGVGVGVTAVGVLLSPPQETIKAPQTNAEIVEWKREFVRRVDVCKGRAVGGVSKITALMMH